MEIVTSEADRAVMAVTIDPDFWRGWLCFVGLRPEKESHPRHRQRMPLRGYLSDTYPGLAAHNLAHDICS